MGLGMVHLGTITPLGCGAEELGLKLQYTQGILRS